MTTSPGERSQFAIKIFSYESPDRSGRCALVLATNDTEGIGDYKISDVKLEYGAIPTTWSSSTDDADTNGYNIYNNSIIVRNYHGATIDRYLGGFKFNLGNGSTASFLRMEKVLQNTKEHTISFKYKLEDGDPLSTYLFKLRHSLGATSYDITATKNEQYISYTIIPDVYDSTYNFIDFIASDQTGTQGKVVITELQVESGTVATKYGLSPSDTNEAIFLSSERISLNLRDAGINLEDDTITLRGDKVIFSDSSGENTGKIRISPEDGSLIAEGTITANKGQIGKWLIQDGDLRTIEDTTSGLPKCIISASNNPYGRGNAEMTFNSTGIIESPSWGNGKTVDQKLKISSDYDSAIEARVVNSHVAYMSSAGFFSNRAGMNPLTLSSGYDARACYVALGNANLKENYYYSNSFICGFYGTSYNSDESSESPNPAPDWGAYINKLNVQGFHSTPKQIDTSERLTKYDTYVSSYSQKKTWVVLPDDPQQGQYIYFKNINGYETVIETEGPQILSAGGNISNSVGASHKGGLYIFYYDGQYWLQSYTHQ